MKKVVILLAAVMLASVIVTACGDKSGPAQAQATDAESGNPAVSGTEPPSPYKQDDGLPEADLDGRTVTFLTATDIGGGRADGHGLGAYRRHADRRHPLPHAKC